MADNPLYPGYTPEDGRSAFYPGFYPGKGKPMRRPIRGKYIKPVEYNFDNALEIIDSVGADYNLAGPGFPRWVVDKTMDDWKENLKVSIKPEDVAQEDLDDYDPKSLPGAYGISLNLNPIDWAKDPGKVLQKTAKNWVASGFNWQDLETRYRQEAWRQVYQDKLGSGGFKYLGEEIGVTALGANIGAAVGLNYNRSANPLRLYNRPVRAEEPNWSERIDTYAVGDLDTTSLAADARVNISGAAVPTTRTIDVGADVAAKSAAFDAVGDFGPAREKAYDEVILAEYRAAVAEAKHDPVRLATITSNPDLKLAFTHGGAALDIADAMKTVGEGFDNYNKGLRITVTKGKGTLAAFAKGDGNALELVNKIDAQFAKMDAAIGRLSALGPDADKQVAYLKKHVEAYKEKITSIRDRSYLKIAQQASSGALTPAQFAALKAQYESISPKDLLNQVSGKSKGGMFSRPISGGSIFDPSLERTFIRNLAVEMETPNKMGMMTMGHFMTELDRLDPDCMTKVLRGNLKMKSVDASRMGLYDFVRATESGDLMERYLWPRVKVYWEASTPAAMTQRFFDRHYFFGLNIGKDNNENFEKTFAYTISNVFNKTGEPNKLFGNWFSIRDAELSARLFGGSHFKAVSKLNELLTNGMTQKELLELLNNTGGKIGLASLVTSGKISSMLKLPEGLLNTAGKDELESFLKQVEELKKFLDDPKNAARVTTTLAKGSEEYYLKLVQLLGLKHSHPDFKTLGIEKKFTGILQKIFYGLNSAQSAILSKVSKLLAPIAYIKMAIVDAVSAAITAALSSATGGLLSWIGGVVRFIINYTLDKIIEIAQVMYKALLQADTEAIFKYIDKSVERFAKIGLGITIAFFMIFYLPGQKFMGVLTTAVSPVDNTKVESVSEYGGIYSGGGKEIVPANIKPSGVGCFVFADSGEADGNLQLESWGNSITLAKAKAGLAIMESTNMGGYLSRLCEKGPINIFHTKPGCGWARSADRIVMGTECDTYPDWYWGYLMAHESGHLYYWRLNNSPDSYNGLTFAGAVNIDGGHTINTYPMATGGPRCSYTTDSFEDYAETIGTWVRINNIDCGNRFTFNAGGPLTDYATQYPGHYKYADEVMTRPYVPASQ